MNLRKLKKEFGGQFAVTRNSRRRTTTVKAAGLTYHVDEHRFSGEREVADHMRSKMPVANILPPI